MLSLRHIVTPLAEGQAVGAGEEVHCHTHERRELLYVVEGSSRFVCHDSAFEAVSGSLFLIDRWQPHAVGYRPEDHGLYHLWLSLYSSEELNVSPVRVVENGEYNLRVPSFTLPREYAMMLERRWELAREEGGAQGAYERLLRVPLLAVLDEVERLLHDVAAEERPGTEAVDGVMESVRSYILSHNARGCSLERLEKLSGYSRFYLAHRFRAVTGMTIGEYINEVRKEYTAAALRRGMRQKEIAAELGFSSPANFWTWLHRHPVEP